MGSFSRRLLALFLAMLMTFSAVPVQAFAADGDQGSSVTDDLTQSGDAEETTEAADATTEAIEDETTQPQESEPETEPDTTEAGSASGGQTPDDSVTESDEDDGEGKKVEEEKTELSGVTKATYFVNIGWTQPYAAWTFDEEAFADAAWPGATMVWDHGEYWRVEVPVEADAITFSDGIAVTEALLAQEAAQGLSVTHEVEVRLDAAKDCYVNGTWKSYADLMAEEAAAEKAAADAAAAGAVQDMIDALDVEVGTQAEADALFEEVCAVEEAIEALTADQQALLDTTNVDAAWDAIAKVNNPEVDENVTWDTSNEPAEAAYDEAAESYDASAVGNTTVGVNGNNTAAPTSTIPEGSEWVEADPFKGGKVCGKYAHGHTDACYTVPNVTACAHHFESVTLGHPSECQYITEACDKNWPKCWKEHATIGGVRGHVGFKCTHTHSVSCYTLGSCSLNGEHDHTEPACFQYIWTLEWKIYDNLSASFSGEGNTAGITAVVTPASAQHNDTVTVTVTLPADADKSVSWTANVDNVPKVLEPGVATTFDATVTGETISVVLSTESVYTVNVSVNPDTPWGSVSATPLSGIKGTDVTVTATPNGVSGAYTYSVAKIEADGTDITESKTFKIGEANANVVVTFARHALEVKANPAMEINGYHSTTDYSKRFENVKENILSAVLKNGYTNADDYNLHIWIDPVAGDPRYFDWDDTETSYTDWTCDRDLLTTVNPGRFPCANFGDTVFATNLKVKIIDNIGRTVETTIAVTEARKAATITVDDVADVTVTDKLDPVAEAAVAAASADSGASVSATVKSGTMPTPSNPTSAITVTLTCGANDKALGGTAEVTVTAKLASYTVTWNPNGGAWDNGFDGTTEVYYGAAPDAPDAPKAENKTFVGWNANNITYDAVDGYNFPVVTKAITYTAAWGDDLNSNGVEDDKETVTINTDIDGNGTITVSGAEKTGENGYIFNSKAEGGNVLTITVAVGDTDGSDGKAGYIAGVEGAEATATAGEYTLNVADDGEYTVTATIGEHKLPDGDKVSTKINLHSSYWTSHLGNLKQIALDAVWGETAYNADEFSVAMQVGSSYLDVTNTLNQIAIAADLANGSISDNFMITWNKAGMPEVSKVYYVEVADSRPVAQIAVGDDLSVEFDAVSEIEEHIKELVSAKYGENSIAVAADAIEITYDVSEVKTDAANDGQVQKIAVSVNVPETAEYQKAEQKEFTVEATGIVHKAKVSVTNDNAKGEVTGLDAEYDYKTATDVSFTVTPKDGYHVEKVTVNDKELSLKDAFQETVFSGKFAVVNGDDNDNTFEVAVEYGKRDFTVKNDPVEVNKFDGDIAKAVFAKAEITAEGYSYGDFVVATEAVELVVGQTYTYTVTLKATEQHPAVTKSISVKIIDERTDWGLNLSSDGLTIDTIDGLEEKIKAAVKIDTSAKEYTVTVDQEKLEEAKKLTQGDSVKVPVTVTAAETNIYNETQKTVDVVVTGKIEAPVVDIVGKEGGQVALVGEPAADENLGNYVRYEVQMTPDAENGYYIDNLTVSYDAETGIAINAKDTAATTADGEIVTKVYSYTGDFFVDGKTTILVHNGYGNALGVVPNYTFTAKFVDPAIQIPETGSMTYYYGMAKDTENLEANVMAALTQENDPIVFAPETLKDADTDILYKAREAETYTYTVTINPADFGIPFISAQTVDIPIVAGELWVKIGTEFDIGTEPTNADIQAVVDNLTAKYNILDLVEMFANDQDALKEIIEEELKANAAFVNFYTNYGAHYFGDYEEEIVKLVIEEHPQYGNVESNVSVLTLEDNRKETGIDIHTTEITYGFTSDELMEAIGASVIGPDGEVVCKPEFVTDVEALGASDEPQTVKVKFDGNEDYKPCEAETTVIINKAPVSVSVDNRLIKWQEDLTYAMPVVTDPAGVDTIKFIVGLDVSNINYDGGIKGILGNVQLMVPESMQTLLESVGLRNGVSMTIAELKGYLDKLGGLFKGTEYEEAVNVLLNMLNSLPTDTADVKVTVGGELPTNIGVYLVGAVSADANYETNFGAGVIAITPNGMRAYIDWKQGDENSVITRGLLTGEPPAYDMGAYVTDVAEGDKAAAEEQIVEIFLGLDIDGNIVLETDQAKLNVGAYTEVAMVVNWGNAMYYAEPIIRAFVVVADSLNVEFVDDTGAVNSERIFTFDNQVQNGMENVKVTYKNGPKAGQIVKEDYQVQYIYAGAQTNAAPYASRTTAPVHAGAYAVTAIVTIRDADGMVSHAGQAIGAMVIEPAKATVDVENVVKEYDGNAVNISEMITVTSEVAGLTPDSTVITAGIDTNGNFSEVGLSAIQGDVNIDFPAWVDQLIAKSDTLKDGMSVADLKGVIASLEELTAEVEASTGVELDTTVFISLNDVLAQLPENAAVTFKDRNELSYASVGAYLVVGVVTDSDHYPALDAGILMIYPKAVKSDLDWKYEDENNIFTTDTLDLMELGADATVNGEYYRDADLLFLGVEAETMKIILVDNQDELNVGVYTEFAYLLDVDSTTYYAEPIVRPVTVVAGKLDVTFVDATGAENADRFFTFDNLPHGMDGVVVSFAQAGDGHAAGAELVNTLEGKTDDALKLIYAGVQTNGVPYASEEAPTHAGAYTVTATYLHRDTETNLVTHAGAAVGALIIEPADADITVTDEFHKYDGNSVAVSGMITVDHAVEGIEPDKTVITAGLATDGSFSENGLSAINTDINIDFPKWVDEIVADIDGLADGMSVAELTAIIDKVDVAVSEYEIEGYELEIFDKLKSVLSQLPQNAKLTFKDASELNYSDVGTYLVIGIVTDSDFYPDMDAGILMIYPDVQKVTLGWIYEDDNNFFTKDTLKIVDLGAQILEDNIAAEPKVLYLGVEAETFEIILTDDQSKLNIGVYDEIGYLVQIDSVTYYAEPISRVITVVAGELDVMFIDENGNANNDRLFSYDGKAHSMEDVVVSYKQKLDDRDDVLLDTSKESNDGNLTIVYTGVQTNGIPYASETAPTHAGTYTVTATYILRDDESGLVTHVGAAVGIMAIEPAEAAVAVDEKLHRYDGNAVAIADMVEITTNNGLQPNATIISAQINTDGTFSEEGLKALKGSINIDFPAWADEILSKFGRIYDGIGVADLIALIEDADAMVSEYEIADYEIEIFDNLKTVLSQLDQNAKLTFKNADELSYSAIGSYLVVGIVTDSNFYPAMDAGVLVIYPDVELGTLEWKNVDKNNIFYLDSLTAGYLDAKALFDGVENPNVDPVEIYVGVDADNWLIHLSDEQPDSVGIYTEIAVLNDTNSNAHYALPIIRPVVVVDGIYDVLFHDENGNVNHERLFTYDGTAKEIGQVYVYGYDKGFYMDEIPAEDELKVMYIGTDSTGDGWCREEAPTDAGVYTVIATYTDYENGEIVGGGAGAGTMVIAKADMALDMKDTTVTYDGEAHFVDVTSKVAHPDYLTVIVDKQKNIINFVLEDDLTIAGGAIKILLEEALDRELDGEFSVTEVQKAIHKVIDAIESYEIPDEIKAVYDKLPTSLQNAIAELKTSTYDPVKAKLDEALALLQSEIPQFGTVIFNGELPVDAGEYQFYGFALSKNYEPEATEGKLTIAPVQIQVVADDQSKVYGEDDPELTYTVKYYDHKGNEVSAVSTDVSVDISRESGEDVGTYSIMLEIAVTDTNFAVAGSTGAVFTITPAAITITVADATKAAGETDPVFTYAITAGKLIGNDDLNVTLAREPGEEVGEYIIDAEWDNDNYDVTVVVGKLTIVAAEETEKGIPVKFTPGDGNGSIKPGGIVDIDGVTYILDENCWAWIDAETYKDLMLATAYKYKEATNITAHTNYPTNMYVWELTLVKDAVGNAVEYIAKPVDELTDFMEYKGTSIRVNGSSNGIRFFTAIPSAGMSKLMNGTLLDGMLEGYKLVGAGTLFMWHDSGKSLTVDGCATSYIYGGDAGSSYRKFSTSGSQDWFTGMLVGLGKDADTLNRDLVVRPFVTISNGENELTIYGGTYQRNIYYVATQNRNYWAPGTALDNYIEGIIATAEGKK